ncbi:MAG: 4Fe-4S dicluster domain-containing protein [Chloroflexota bacterium]|nr:4Fe-4S binding protein [Chloroflexota bacterium]MBI5704036.1 4Fe-4S binding protein [Chloroflexota bacterium]
MTKKLYTERRFLRTLEKAWAFIEGSINRFAHSDFNPLYHLGTLTIFMLVVLIATGAYLTVIYRPGLDVAYATVEKIDSNWFGSLMRSVHRYAADAMILLTILHLVKILVSDKFWGQRWLAWTSGWIMLAVTWLVGTMGYWLVWDQRAQWMTEYMMETLAGSSGLTYIAADIESRTFSNFVIILFLHVFLPLIGFLGIYIHGLRLSRARWWSPRWVSIQAAVGLLVLSLIKPVQSFAPADLSTLIQSVPMDAYYLGFLPLIDKLGNVIFWGLAILIGGSLFLLPWLASGRDLGPALVTDPKCTGCVLCYAECPYDAIRMVQRNDNSGYQKLAVINAAQCTGCGICVGACPTDAIHLQGGYNSEQTFNALRGAVHREVKEGHTVTVLFASQRAQALGGLPITLLPQEEGQGMREHPHITVTGWGGDEAARVITAVLPSVGAVNIEWIKSLLNGDGARDVVILSHPYDDALNREDAHWILNRLHLRPALLTKGLHWLEVTPGDAGTVAKFLDELHSERGQANKTAPLLPPVKGRNKLVPSFVSALVGTALLLGLFALALPLDVKAGMSAAEKSALRVAVDAKGKVQLADIPEGVALPEGADPAKIFGGEHYPMSVRVLVDSMTMLDETYKPSGISGNGRISALEFLEIEPGAHQVEVWVKDDSDEYRLAFSNQVVFDKGKVMLLLYDEARDAFVVR